MKILMLGWELPPHNSGGLGVACYHLCKALSKKDIDIEFILPYTAPHADINFMDVTAASPQGVAEVLQSGIAYDSYRYLFQDGHEELHDIVGQQFLFERAVEHLVEEKEFDIVHAHDWLTFRAAMRIKAQTGCPIVLHVHSIESDRSGGNKGNPLVHDIENVALHMADRVIAVSEFTKQAIIRDYGIHADKIEVIHNSIDQQSIAPISDQNAYRYLSALRAQGYRVVVSVSRLTIQKGIPNLLRAAKQVIDRAPKTIFLIVGSGDQYYELLELAADLGITKNVIFTGFLRGKEWRDSFSIADLFVLPSVSEPFGLTPLEAISYGTPSLVTKQSGVSEILNNCLKVDFWDVNEMANQIVAVVQNDSLHDALLENAYVEYRKLSWRDAANKVEAIYKAHLPVGASA